MIREYKPEDFNNINANDFYIEGFVGEEKFKELLTNDNVYTYSQVKGEKVLCIIIFFCIGHGIYQSGLIFSKNYLSIYVKEFKKFLYDSIKSYNIRRLETESIDCDVLNRWHKFLGFSCDGLKEDYINNKDYRLWSILQKNIKGF